MLNQANVNFPLSNNEGRSSTFENYLYLLLFFEQFISMREVGEPQNVAPLPFDFRFESFLDKVAFFCVAPSPFLSVF